MAKIDFDNLMKTIKVTSTGVGATIVSVEVDLELPRGFIAKFSGWEFNISDLHEDFEGLIAGGGQFGLAAVIIRDPDDAATVVMPVNEVQHDVWDEFRYSQAIIAEGLFVTETRKQFFAKEGDDWITARNLRFNIAGTGPDVADIQELQMHWIGYYKLEKVTDADILNLLDIL